MKTTCEILRKAGMLCSLVLCMVMLATLPAGAITKYAFVYYYTDGSGDCYNGTVFAPDNWLSMGQRLYYQPRELGGGALNGYYYISYSQPGYDASYGAQEYITSYYDADKAGALLGVNRYGASYVANNVYVADRRYNYESGYALKGTADDNFTPFREADVSDFVRFVVLGDSQTDWSNFSDEFLHHNYSSSLFDHGESVNTVILNSIVSEIINNIGGLPDFVVFLGDMGNWGCNYNQDPPLTWGDWLTAMRPLTDRGVRLYNVVGNHDLYDINVLGYKFMQAEGESSITGGLIDALEHGLDSSVYQGSVDTASREALNTDWAYWLQSQFLSIFNQTRYYEDNFQQNPSNSLNFCFELGNSFFVFLDSYLIYPDGTGYNSYYQKISPEQLTWLAEQAAATTKAHKFAFAHSPALWGNIGDWDQDLWKILDEYNFDIFFAADKHLYSRIVFPDTFTYYWNYVEWFTNTLNIYDENYNVIGSYEETIEVITPMSADITDYTNNVTQIISGGAGAPLTEGIPSDDYFWNRSRYNFLVLDVYGSSYENTNVIETAYGYPLPNGWALLSNSAVYKYSRYDFTYYYGGAYSGGDSYIGYVYAPTGYNGYAMGYVQYTTDENGQSGYYYIHDATDAGNDGSLAGKVFVTSYYDTYCGQTLTPLHNGTAVGASYLGSEYDDIPSLSGLIIDSYFGGGYYEANEKHIVHENPLSPGSPQFAAAQSQAVWAAYWRQSASLLEEER